MDATPYVKRLLAERRAELRRRAARHPMVVTKLIVYANVRPVLRALEKVSRELDRLSRA